MAYQQQQNFRTEKWEILDQLALTENTRRRLVYSLKTPENSAQLFVDLGSYINDPNSETRVTGLCLQLPQIIECRRTGRVAESRQGVCEKEAILGNLRPRSLAGGASATAGDGQTSARSSLLRIAL